MNADTSEETFQRCCAAAKGASADAHARVAGMMAEGCSEGDARSAVAIGMLQVACVILFRTSYTREELTTLVIQSVALAEVAESDGTA